MFKEFREFISKGNVMDLAVGVIIGAAFQAIVKSLVDDIIMPLLAPITGSVDFTTWVATIPTGNGNIELKYGNFVSAVFNFLIMSFVIFIIIKTLNNLSKKNKESLAKVSARITKLDKFGVKDKIGKLSKKKKKEEVEVEPETKLCPYCLSEIPYHATKCSHCTSDLESITKEEEKQ